MIQELLGAVVEERKISNNMPGPLIVDNSPTISSNSSPSQSAASSPSSTSTENLRCPRCDSANTKFCYYNNYNLTQPRHFCKTCRRYWTKGGALRNVPIGGGCRKTKAAASAIPTIASVKSRASAMPMSDIGRAVGSTGGGEHDMLSSNQILWGACGVPHSSHLLALLRVSQAQQQQQQQQHNHNQLLGSHAILNSIRVKEEANMLGPHVSAEAYGLGLDPLGQLCSNNNSWRNESTHFQYQNQNLFLGDAPTSSGIQELYQRLRAPANCGGNDHLMIGSNVGNSGSSSAATTTMATTTTASLLEPMPLSGGDFGYWNPGLAWADISMPNAAFP